MARFRTSIATTGGPVKAVSDGWVAVFANEPGVFRERVLLVIRERTVVPLVLDDDGRGFSRATDYPNFLRIEEQANA